MTTAAFFLARRFGTTRPNRLTIGAATGVAVGVLKEVGDVLHWWPGGLSLRDLGADLIGVASSLVIVAAWEAYYPTVTAPLAPSEV